MESRAGGASKVVSLMPAVERKGCAGGPRGGREKNGLGCVEVHGLTADCQEAMNGRSSKTAF